MTLVKRLPRGFEWLSALFWRGILRNGGWSLLAINACLGDSYVKSQITPPGIDREFRGAWVASVANISWPSSPSLTTQQQKAELVGLLDTCSRLRMNALILQVRPACDALYASKLEPWSEFLTGTMGKAPEPFYDPLEFAVREAHSRGIELHAWFNPYRARHLTAKSPISPNHVSQKRPGLVRNYGRFLWLDPGEKEVRDYTLSVVLDVVKRYDIDGVHFDDYFYPYPEKDSAGRPVPFPDDASWKRYGAGHGLSLEDWRRENVNALIRKVYQEIKVAKPWVKFGISPFGIWRPGNPPQVQGKDSYEELYADSRKWLEKGWLDYCAPQLYWPIDSELQSFPALLKWWEQQNPTGKHLWPGLNTFKAGRFWKPEEIARQIELIRGPGGAAGHIHWDLRKGVAANPELQKVLQRVYAAPALVPASPWLASRKPGLPSLAAKVESGRLTAQWRPAGTENVWLWAVQFRANGTWQTDILPGGRLSRSWGAKLPDVIAIRAVDRVGQTGPAAVVGNP